MKRQTVCVAAGAAALSAAGMWFIVPQAAQAQRTFVAAAPSEVYVLRGKLSVQVAMDPSAGSAAADWTGPIKDVDEVTLLNNFAILRKTHAGTTGTLIVPRDRLVYINMMD